MTMTTTAAQELLRGDAQIEAPPVGGRMREASATSAHLHSLFVLWFWSVGRNFNVHSLIQQQILTHGLNPISETSLNKKNLI